MPTKNSKFIPGIGRDSTVTYRSLKRFLTASESDRSAHLKHSPFDKVTSFMKYGGTEPEIAVSLLDIVYLVL